MEEVIAERSKGAFALYICMSILCLILMGTGVILWDRGGVYYLVMGGVCLAFFGVVLVLVLRTPQKIAVRVDEDLYFCGQQYKLRDIVRVEYRNAHRRSSHYPWGTLEVYFADGRIAKSRFVADVEQAHNRLIELMREYVAGGEQSCGK